MDSISKHHLSILAESMEEETINNQKERKETIEID
jgi:hypothetical protein